MSESTIISCPSCGAANRVPQEKLDAGLAPVCGRCKAPLSMSTGKPVVVTDQNFSELVDRSDLPVLLDMWAPWCGPCRMISPVVEELAREYAGRLRVGKMNVDENPHTSQRFTIQSIPSLLVLRNGAEVGRIVGAQSKANIVSQLQQVLF